jgi:hypothetical protein
MAITTTSQAEPFKAVFPVTADSTHEPNGLTAFAQVVMAVQPDGTPADSTDALSAIGAPGDTAWNGTDPAATVISLLKAIAINTAP